MESKWKDYLKEKIDEYISVKTLILGTVFLSLTIILMTGLTLSRYEDKIDGYASIKPASFYAKLMADNTQHRLESKKEEFKAIDFGRESGNVSEDSSYALKMQLAPGLKYTDESKEESDVKAVTVRFAVGNSNFAERKSEIPITYTLQVITTRNIPMEVKLVPLKDNEEDDTLTWKWDKTRKFTSQAAKASLDDTIGNAYIYHFYNDGGEASGQEAEFSLDGTSERIHRYELQFRWKADPKYNSAAYAKEIDVVEVRAFVKGDPVAEAAKLSEDEDYYADAYVRLHLPAAGGAASVMNETIRSEVRIFDMKPDSIKDENDESAKKMLTHTFQVYNGDIGREHLDEDMEATYQVTLEIPMGAPTAPARYTLYDEDEKKEYKAISQGDNAVTFVDESNHIKNFRLRKVVDGYARVDHDNLTIRLDDAELIDQVEQYGKDHKATDMLRSSYQIRIDAKYATPTGGSTP